MLHAWSRGRCLVCGISDRDERDKSCPGSPTAGQAHQAWQPPPPRSSYSRLDPSFKMIRLGEMLLDAGATAAEIWRAMEAQKREENYSCQTPSAMPPASPGEPLWTPGEKDEASGI